jgi:hypothetical protein
LKYDEEIGSILLPKPEVGKVDELAERMSVLCQEIAKLMEKGELARGERASELAC